MRFIDFFAGIGGISLGLERAGHTCVGHCEIDEYACKVLKKHWPDVPLFGDLTEIVECLDMVAKECDNTDEGVNIMAGKLKKMKPEQVVEAIAMYEAGLSLQDVGDYFSVTRQAMWDLLRRRITLRPQKRTGKDNHFHRGGKTMDKRSQHLVEKAIAKGVLIRPATCSECNGDQEYTDGRAGIQAHHDDYNKPLEVRWLCQKCHHAWHKTNKAIELEDDGTLPPADVWAAGFP